MITLSSDRFFASKVMVFRVLSGIILIEDPASTKMRPIFCPPQSPVMYNGRLWSAVPIRRSSTVKFIQAARLAVNRASYIFCSMKYDLYFSGFCKAWISTSLRSCDIINASNMLSSAGILRRCASTLYSSPVDRVFSGFLPKPSISLLLFWVLSFPLSESLGAYLSGT
jgi:hypothetical protein